MKEKLSWNLQGDKDITKTI